MVTEPRPVAPQEALRRAGRGRSQISGAPVRTRTLVARAVAVLRVVQLVPWPVSVALGAGGFTHPAVAAVVYGVQAVTAMTVAGRLWSQRDLPSVLVGFDVAVAAVCLPAAGWASVTELATGWANSAIAPAIGTAVVAAVFWPAPRAAAAGAVLVLAYVGGVARGLDAAAALATTVGNVVSISGAAVVGGAVAAHLVREATRTEELLTEVEAGRDALAAEDALRVERRHQYRMLHDTVLSTLSAIARGGVEPADPLVRQRCAADADYLRGLITSDPGSTGARLAGELAAVGHELAALGLRVHTRGDAIPDTLPAAVVRALAEAVREALNNVARHAGVSEAWVTAVGQQGGVLVTVADRGRGFDPVVTRAAWACGRPSPPGCGRSAVAASWTPSPVRARAWS